MLQDNEKIPRILVLARNSKASLQRLQGFLLVLCLKHTGLLQGNRGLLHETHSDDDLSVTEINYL